MNLKRNNVALAKRTIIRLVLSQKNAHLVFTPVNAASHYQVNTSFNQFNEAFKSTNHSMLPDTNFCHLDHPDKRPSQ